MTILLILIACIKGIVLFLGIDKIARISQSKNYMMGALIASFAVGAYSQKSVHDYMGSPGIEGFFFTLILFAIVSALGFVYCWLLGIKPSRQIVFKPDWFTYLLYFVPSLLWALFVYEGTYRYSPGAAWTFVAAIFILAFVTPSVVLAVSTLMSCFLFGFVAHGIVVDFMDTPTADAAMPDDCYDATDIDVDNSDSVTTIDTTDSTGVEHVDGHYREGTYVHGYSRADGTWVDGHYRDGGDVSPHIRKK